MNLLGHTALGVLILLLLGVLVIVKRVATGKILDAPQGTLLVQLVNVFNLFFLLVVNPLAAISLLSRRIDALDPSRIAIKDPLILAAVEIAGLAVYVWGFLLMNWALITLGKFYQLGGTAPRPEDEMVDGGPYRIIRHPMYAAVLSISLGLSFLVQSWAFLSVFVIYLGLILQLIPLEEERLLNAYGDLYRAYQRRTRKLMFFKPPSAVDK